ncbi:outer membrane protein assembly factor BamE [uncultured Tateyamaria sp.]|uniref:outer membrane protein assembly factor BamE n=1 Tax=uncultured Tateyamaria sp. TaxID=455651 RepID=UPI002612C768|nr:outer membrane protein assembly factor BamE [uncultured Tateyamaria sp.]
MRTFTASLVTVLALSVAACAPTFRNHGYIPPEEDLQELVVGIDTRASVEDLVGPPTAGGVLEGGDYFYVRSRVRTFGPRRPQVVDRQVLAVSFDAEGVLQNIERFGLEDGNVVRLDRRVTDNGTTNIGFLRQLLGNIGRVGPAGAFGGDG